MDSLSLLISRKIMNRVEFIKAKRICTILKREIIVDKNVRERKKEGEEVAINMHFTADVDKAKLL